MKISASTLAISLALLGAASFSPGRAMENHTTVLPDQEQWGPVPPGLPAGAQVAILFGNPEKDGPFVARMKAPKGYYIPPHSHSQLEVVTVLSGTLAMGHGESGDRGKAQPLPARGVVVLPPGTIHSLYAETDTILQVNGMGPFDIKYVNQKDDPRAKSQ